MINLCDPMFVSSEIPVDSFFITVVLVFHKDVIGFWV